MDERLEKLEKEVAGIRARNQKVEAGKAWEQSGTRLLSIAVVTYIIASIVLYFIHAPVFYLSALVPTIGYLLSVQSLPFIKDWWIERYVKRQEQK